MPEPSKKDLCPGVGVDGCKLPSPSTINTWGTPLQALVVLVYFGLLGGLTHALIGLFQSYGVPSGAKIPMGLGVFYTFVGVSHVLSPADFENIVPAWGTWGLWYVPGTPGFHVLWTSAVEVAGGLGLLAGGTSKLVGGLPVVESAAWASSAGLLSDCAFALFVMTVGVTPANLYMLTHGAKLPKDSPPLPLGFHGFRLAVQALILASLYRLGQETFDMVLMGGNDEGATETD